MRRPAYLPTAGVSPGRSPPLCPPRAYVPVADSDEASVEQGIYLPLTRVGAPDECPDSSPLPRCPFEPVFQEDLSWVLDLVPVTDDPGPCASEVVPSPNEEARSERTKSSRRATRNRMRCSWRVRGRRSRRRGLRRAGSHGPRGQYRRSSPGEVRLGVSWAWPRRLPTVVVAAEPHDRGGSSSLKRVGEFGDGHVNHAFPPVEKY